MKASLFLFFTLPFLLTGCDDGRNDDQHINSSNVSTSRIYVGAHVTSDSGNKVQVEVQLTQDSPPSPLSGDTFIDLLNGDELWVSTNESNNLSLGDDLFSALDGYAGSQVRMRQSVDHGNNNFEDIVEDILNIILLLDFSDEEVRGEWYIGDIKYDEAARFYRLSLSRPNGISVESTVTLPNAFTMSSPLSNESYSRAANDIRVDWSPIDPDSSVNIKTLVSCPNQARQEFTFTLVADTGSYTIAAGDIDSTLVTGTCPTTILVTKNKPGTLGNSFIGGKIVGHQTKAIVVTTTD